MTMQTPPSAATPSREELVRSLSSITWPYVIGFALAQTWTVLCIALPDPVTYGEPFMDLRWVSLVTAAVFSLLAAARRRIESLVTSNHAFFLAVGAVSCAASLLGPISVLFSPGTSGVLLHVAAVGVGIGFAWLYVGWYARFCAAQDMIGLASSVVASLCLTYPLANVLSTDQISPWISAFVGSLLPILSVVLAGADQTKDPPLPAARNDAAPLDRTQRLLCLRFGICLCIVVTVVETTRNFLLGGTAIAFYAGIANLGGAALKVACAVWLVGVFASKQARGVSDSYRLSFLLILGIVLCIPLLLQGNWFAHMLLDVGSFFFHMVTLMVAYQISVGFAVRPARVFGFTRSLWAAGTLMGICIESLRMAHGVQILQLLPVALGLSAAAAFLFMFTDRDCTTILASMPAPAPPADFESKVASLAERHRVSERELEVMMLVAKGRSSTRIAQMLGVSLATVNSHVHHVYQKLGIHSRQELMDAIETETSSIH